MRHINFLFLVLGASFSIQASDNLDNILSNTLARTKIKYVACSMQFRIKESGRAHIYNTLSIDSEAADSQPSVGNLGLFDDLLGMECPQGTDTHSYVKITNRRGQVKKVGGYTVGFEVHGNNNQAVLNVYANAITYKGRITEDGKWSSGTVAPYKLVASELIDPNKTASFVIPVNEKYLLDPRDNSHAEMQDVLITCSPSKATAYLDVEEEAPLADFYRKTTCTHRSELRLSASQDAQSIAK